MAEVRLSCCIGRTDASGFWAHMLFHLLHSARGARVEPRRLAPGTVCARGMSLERMRCMRLFAAALRPKEGDEPGGGDDMAEATGGTDPVVLDATGGVYPVAEDADVDGTKTDMNCDDSDDEEAADSIFEWRWAGLHATQIDHVHAATFEC